MYLINTRKHTTDSKKFSEIDRLLYADGLKQQIPVSRTTFEQCIRSKNVLVLVHGFNNPYPQLLKQYLLSKARFKSNIPEAYEAVIGFTWPAGETEFDYFLAKGNTEEAGKRLRSWLVRLTEVNSTIDILGHSMAAKVGFHALKQDSNISIRNVFSFGAAISRDTLKNSKVISELFEKVEHFYAFRNENDAILKYAFRLMEWKEALGYSGLPKGSSEYLDHDKITIVDCSGVIKNHVDYTGSEMISRVIEEVLKGRDFGKKVLLSEQSVSMPALNNSGDGIQENAKAI